MFGGGGERRIEVRKTGQVGNGKVRKARLEERRGQKGICRMGNRGRLERQELFGLGLSGRQRSGGKHRLDVQGLLGMAGGGRGQMRNEGVGVGGGGWMARGC